MSIDLSRAVDQIRALLREQEDVLVLQADLFRTPLQEGRFDFVSCHRMIQPTPDPEGAFRSISRQVRSSDTLFVHSYDTHWKPQLQAKYLWRPITTRRPHRWVYRAPRMVGPLRYPLTGAPRRWAFSASR